MMREDQERKRLRENTEGKVFWKRWGPYLSERQWGTVREDYSPDGEPWLYFPHDHARSRAYRWGEDGLGGICDVHQNLCFALALWNGRDPILKERLFGLTGLEGNHGEDVKELYYYLDNTPTHAYMKYLYKYPQERFPYEQLVEENGRRTRQQPEYEITDTGVFSENRYFDVYIEYAKEGPEDLFIRITVWNRHDQPARIHLLPTLWFRNKWEFGSGDPKPVIGMDPDRPECLTCDHEGLGPMFLYHEKARAVWFTENETNTQRLFGQPNDHPRVKDAIGRAVVDGETAPLENVRAGTKASVHHVLEIPGQAKQEIWLRLTASPSANPLSAGPAVMEARLQEADQFYQSLAPASAGAQQRLIQRQAYAGLLWNKIHYNYEQETWINGDPGKPAPPAGRRTGRNAGWAHLFNRDVLSVPDKWEYPWYATWDTAFHCVALAGVDPAFAKSQLLLLLREWYMHPNGQVPAYEWALDDVNPPVHAWACLKVYQMDKRSSGTGDTVFLKRVFHKLLLNFTWWVNRKDPEGRNVFQGGFLGLDNIGLFDRSMPVPDGGQLEQADGTAWMAMYALNMMTMALELAGEDRTYEDMASKFFEHFVYIAEAFNHPGGDGNIRLWDEDDGFFYDALYYGGNRSCSVKARSMVGLIPLLAVAVIEGNMLDRFPEFAKRLRWFQENRSSVERHLFPEPVDSSEQVFFSLVGKDRLLRILDKVLDEEEFLAPGGIRSMSRYHEAHPLQVSLGNQRYELHFEPGESESGLFGGNSNWRGPVWIPVNYLLLEAFRTYCSYYGERLMLAFPTGSGETFTLTEICTKLSERLTGMFIADNEGRRQIHGHDSIYVKDVHCTQLLLFHEYFHGLTGEGLGASHQTGWTALIARMISEQYGE